MTPLKAIIKAILPERLRRSLQLARIAHLEGKQWHMLSWGAPATYRQDGLLSVHATGFDCDPRFAEAYAKGKATGSWGLSEVHWRAYIACWFAQHVIELGGGDFIEAGANRGGTALTIINYLGSNAFVDRKYYLLDTFNGLDPSQLTQNEAYKMKRFGQPYVECYEDVKQTFRDYNFVNLVRGPIPGTLPEVESKRIIYLHIDLNSAKPEVATLRYFWDKIVVGGVVLFDDYGWYESKDQRQALDALATEYHTKILALPTGQGLLIKT